MNDWYIITNENKNQFIGQDKQGNLYITMFLSGAKIDSYNMLKLFMNHYMNDEIYKSFSIKKLQII